MRTRPRLRAPLAVLTAALGLWTAEVLAAGVHVEAGAQVEVGVEVEEAPRVEERTVRTGRIGFTGTLCRLQTKPGDVFRRLEVMGTGRSLGPEFTSLATRLILDLGPSGIAAAYDPLGVLHVVEAQATFAPIDREDGRVRLTAGAGMVADDAGAVLGPRAGVLLTWRLAGAVFFDGQVALTPVPFTAFDARAGFALEMVFFRLEAGLRGTWVVHRGREVVTFGPAFGGGLVF
jgi:hypothetical protein